MGEEEKLKIGERMVRIETLIKNLETQVKDTNKFLHNNIEHRMDNFVSKWEVRIYVAIFTAFVSAICVLLH